MVIYLVQITKTKLPPKLKLILKIKFDERNKIQEMSKLIENKEQKQKQERGQRKGNPSLTDTVIFREIDEQLVVYWLIRERALRTASDNIIQIEDIKG